MRHFLILTLVMLVACATPSVTVVDDGPENVRVAYESTVELSYTIRGVGTCRASGVCIAVGKKTSIVATAGHVYHKGLKKINVVTYDGKKLKGVMFAISDTDDLALISVKGRIKPATQAFGMPALGSRVFVVGNKLGGGLWPTDGIYGGQVSDNFARCSAPTHPGNSGGGVFNNLKLIGIVSRISAMTSKTSNPLIKSKQLFPTTCMFVPINRVRLLVIKHGGISRMLDREFKPVTGSHKVILPPKPEEWRYVR